MPRRNRPRKASSDRTARKSSDVPLGHSLWAGTKTVVTRSGEYYLVQQVSGQRMTKHYRCPGCEQLVTMNTPHTVAWPMEDIDARRHWHTICWTRFGLHL